MNPPVVVEAAGDLMIIRFRGRIGAMEMAGYVAEIERATATLSAGFVLLTDLTDLETMDLECTAYIRKGMDVCRTRGVVSIVRVVPDPSRDIGFNIMSLFHYPRSVRILTCTTLAEGLKVVSERSAG